MNRKQTHGTTLRAALAATTLALLLGPGPAHAGGWHWTITPYAWLTDVSVGVDLDGREVVDEKIPVGDLIEDLDTIFQVRVEAQNGPYGVSLDLFDVTMSDEVLGATLPQGAGEADLASDVGLTILDVAGLYDPSGDRVGFAFLGGTRILNERATIDATLRPTSGTPVARQYETNDTMVDALVGVRYTKRFSRHWSARMQADASTGGTDFTWSVAPTIGYSFGETGRYSVVAGYRSLTVDFQDEAGVDATMTLSGAQFGLRLAF